MTSSDIDKLQNLTKYQVFIQGVPYGTIQPTRMLAEMLLTNLTPDQKILAEIKPVTVSGQQLLFE